ncbi:hypothetical protein [Micromonospora sp. NPDC093277]|uniref:hypothetical protein n=1 Tax=Micromonospora sp. NPDC093277 TaxID=3364291 RepID=UPI003828A57B
MTDPRRWPDPGEQDPAQREQLAEFSVPLGAAGEVRTDELTITGRPDRAGRT